MTAFRFSPVKDLSVLVDNDFAIDFWVRCDYRTARIDTRFVDTKTDEPGDHPWRMRYRIADSNVQWDGQWKHLHIPLHEFSEHGSWDDGWFNPAGRFDWTAVDRFEIVPEYSDLHGIHFYFDNICIIDPAVNVQTSL